MKPILIKPIVIVVIIAVAALLLVATTVIRLHNTDLAWHAADKSAALNLKRLLLLLCRASSGRLLARNFAAKIGPKLFRVVSNLRAPYACAIR